MIQPPIESLRDFAPLRLCVNRFLKFRSSRQGAKSQRKTAKKTSFARFWRKARHDTMRAIFFGSTHPERGPLKK
jgi:hypothetical protein